MVYGAVKCRTVGDDFAGECHDFRAFAVKMRVRIRILFEMKRKVCKNY
jgi:hypothetical protein